MNVSELMDTMEHLYGQSIPTADHPSEHFSVWVASKPGVGKSGSIRHTLIPRLEKIYREPFGFIDKRPAQCDPGEIGSLPYIEDGLSKLTKPEWIPTEGRGIVVIEEIADAPLLVQSAFYQFVLDRELGGVKLGDGWMIALCSNRQEDKAAAGRTSTALNNRCVHLELEVDLDTSIEHALNNNWHPVLPGLWKTQPELLHTMDPKSKEKAFASPRTWEMISNILKSNPPESLRYNLLKGTIGEGPAGTLEGFLQIHDELPNIDSIAADPEGTDVPTSPSACWVLSGAMAAAATENNFSNFLVYADRLTSDYVVFFLMNALKKNEDLKKTKAFRDWATKNSEIFVTHVQA